MFVARSAGKMTRRAALSLVAAHAAARFTLCVFVQVHHILDQI